MGRFSDKSIRAIFYKSTGEFELDIGSLYVTTHQVLRLENVLMLGFGSRHFLRFIVLYMLQVLSAGQSYADRKVFQASQCSQ